MAKEPVQLKATPTPPKKEVILEKPKVPLESEKDQEVNVREIIEGVEKKKDTNSNVELSNPAKKVPSPSPRSSPIKDFSRGSTTPPSVPSPLRSRATSVESLSSSKRDSVELEAIKLPSVRQLAQQFSVS